MPEDLTVRRVTVLAPMPLELDAIVRAFGLTASSDEGGATYTGRLGQAEVTALHIGMGPGATRSALRRLFEESAALSRPVHHVMIAGICGGLDPELPVGTIVNPELLVDHASGATYRHRPPGDVPVSGKLVTTEQATLDPEQSRRFFDEGCLAVDMESSAAAEVCEQHGCDWSVYRCIGDRIFDGLLDERIVAATNPDGSGKMDEIAALLRSDPDLSQKLERLGRDATNAARLAAEAAVRGCLALDA